MSKRLWGGLDGDVVGIGGLGGLINVANRNTPCRLVMSILVLLRLLLLTVCEELQPPQRLFNTCHGAN